MLAYPCCRWAHPAIDACVGLMKENKISYKDVSKVVIKTFERATLLSKIHPQTADEAQYNIAYPVAVAVVYGDFGIQNVMEESLNDPEILSMMEKLYFEVDERLDSMFPAKRICRAEIYTNDGKVYVSGECEPRGEAHENIGTDWLCDKFCRITAPFISKMGQSTILKQITENENISVREIVKTVNEFLLEKK